MSVQSQINMLVAHIKLLETRIAVMDERLNELESGPRIPTTFCSSSEIEEDPRPTQRRAQRGRGGHAHHSDPFAPPSTSTVL